MENHRYQVGQTIAFYIQKLQCVATAKVSALYPLDRVQIIECSLPQYNYMVVADEDIINRLCKPSSGFEIKGKQPKKALCMPSSLSFRTLAI